MTVRLRPATIDDARLLFDWANDAGVRGASFSTDAIEWDDHIQWLGRQLADDDADVCIVMDDGDPIGTVRLHRDGDRATISIALDGAARGGGRGTAAIRAGVASAWAQGAAAVDAFIKPDNTASRAAFERAGFALEGTTEVRGVPALHYVATVS